MLLGSPSRSLLVSHKCCDGLSRVSKSDLSARFRSDGPSVWMEISHMVDRNLLREFGVEDSELDAVMSASFPDFADDESVFYESEAQTYGLNDILTGTIVRVDSEEVVVDIGFKSEGVVQRDEWDEEEAQPEL